MDDNSIVKYRELLNNFVGRDLSLFIDFIGFSGNWNFVECFNDYKYVFQSKTGDKFIMVKFFLHENGECVISEIYAKNGIYREDLKKFDNSK